MNRGRVFVAMSGGVDSSVAALLLKEAGYQVVGVTMRLYSLANGTPPYYRGCCSLDDVEDARRACHRIGIPHYVVNMEEEFRTFVIDYFCREYRRGRTPNPCLACNEWIKFTFLLRRARFLGADFLATGHYARIVPSNGGWRLLKAVDPLKDQSYVLYMMGQEELAHTLMPIGWHTKEEVRRIAQEAGLPNASKPDSREVCFIPDGDYRPFLAGRMPLSPGPIVDREGNILGTHRGIELFTVGQRRGLGIAAGRPLFVTGLDPHHRQVIVGPEEELYTDILLASEVRYTSGREPKGPLGIKAKIRYRSPEADAVLYPDGGRALVRFLKPQRAVTPGQAVVFYRGEEVLGGGIIETATRLLGERLLEKAEACP
jgi:tRNA-specific 2-thiouridylase